MSVYDGESETLFERCLESLTLQSDKPSEFILVIDGPLRPALYNIINSYSENLQVNIYKLDANVGLGAALDFGYQKCRGEWIVRCDSDDFYRPKHFHTLKQLCLVAESNCAVIGSSIEELLHPGFKKVSQRRFPAKVNSFGVVLRDPFAHPAVAIRTSALKTVGGYSGPLYFEDTYLWLRLFKAGYYGLNVDSFLVQMSVSDDFYDRRRGIAYARFEFLAYRRFFRENLLTWYQLFAGAIRLIIRLLPRFVIKYIYKWFLRD